MATASHCAHEIPFVWIRTRFFSSLHPHKHMALTDTHSHLHSLHFILIDRHCAKFGRASSWQNTLQYNTILYSSVRFISRTFRMLNSTEQCHLKTIHECFSLALLDLNSRMCHSSAQLIFETLLGIVFLLYSGLLFDSERLEWKIWLNTVGPICLNNTFGNGDEVRWPQHKQKLGGKKPTVCYSHARNREIQIDTNMFLFLIDPSMCTFIIICMFCIFSKFAGSPECFCVRQQATHVHKIKKKNNALLVSEGE